ncbi:hypothetical protein [Salinibacterium sp. GXW1014]|uniref:hypothetical protein n=1 Tax=Salinibacterium sp. GXW1014 TaxID=3377838 RepID=UPI00383B944B
MGTSFYSDRVNGSVAREHETLPSATAEGLKSLVQRRIDSNWLAKEFPSFCPDGAGITGTNHHDIGPDLSALVPGVEWPLWDGVVTDETLFDVVEYVAQRVAKPTDGPYHSFFKHYELNFDETAGRAEFREDVNVRLKRGGTVFEMSEQMQIQRVGTPEVQAALRQLRPASGDSTLDSLIETARELYVSRSVADRATAIEKLWDGFERLKTIDDPTDKKRSVTRLLGHIADAAFRDVLAEEMTFLTKVGNSFQIRHHEVGKHPIPSGSQDYFAARMSNLIVTLLAQSGRLGVA